MLLTTELDKLSGTDWQLFFAQERAKPYFAELDAFVTAAAAEKTVYPAAENIFAAFRACPVSAVRVVILGQDPASYSGAGWDERVNADAQSFGIYYGLTAQVNQPVTRATMRVC